MTRIAAVAASAGILGSAERHVAIIDTQVASVARHVASVAGYVADVAGYVADVAGYVADVAGCVAIVATCAATVARRVASPFSLSANHRRVRGNLRPMRGTHRHVRGSHRGTSVFPLRRPGRRHPAPAQEASFPPADSYLRATFGKLKASEIRVNRGDVRGFSLLTIETIARRRRSTAR